jgi:ABC-type multidrug transport system fused ATPase/permease subunit
MDKKTRFFKTVLLVQFIPALLFGVLILMNFRSQKILKIRGLHPYEFNYGQIAPLLIFGIAFFIGVLTLFFKAQETENTEEETQKIIRQKNFWKFAFYSNVFFLTIITVFSIAIYFKKPFVIQEVVFFYSLVFSRAILVIILSLLLGAFLLATGIYWKTNKAMGGIIFLFGFFIVLMSFAYEVVFIDQFMSASLRYNDYVDSKKSNSNEVKETGDYEDETDNEDYAYEEHEAKLISSWKSLIQDWGGLEGKYDFYDVRILLNRSLEDNITINDYYYFVQEVDDLRKNPEEFYSAFENYRSVFYNLVSPATYHAANFDKIVEGLLLTYDDIGEDNQKLEEIYNAMNVSNDTPGPTMEGYYAQFENNFSLSIIQKLQNYKLTNGDGFKDSDLMWFYSFWARRNKEGTAKDIAIILNEIKEYYNKTEE